MPPQDRFKLKKTAAIAAIISAILPASVYGTAGRVEFAFGNVQAISVDGARRALTKGSAIMSGDTILTTVGRAHVRFSDGAYVSLKPNTEFKVDEYNFDRETAANNRGFFSLFRGGFRTITGFIGRKNRAAYRMRTPVATIGIRGTHYSVDVDEPNRGKGEAGGSAKEVVVGNILNYLDSAEIVLKINPNFTVPTGGGANVEKAMDHPGSGDTTYTISMIEITGQGEDAKPGKKTGEAYKVIIKADGGVQLQVYDPATGTWVDTELDEKTQQLLKGGAADADFSTDLGDDNPDLQDMNDDLQNFIDDAADVAYGG